MIRLLLAFAVLNALTAWVAAAGWDVRYAHQPDQKKEWTDNGWIPAWKVTTKGEEITWEDTATGACRGWLVFGHPVTLQPGTVSVQLSLEFKSHCDMDEPRPRGGIMWTALVTRDVWESLATEPTAAKILDRREALSKAPCVSIKGGGDDVDEWRASGPVSFGSISNEMRDSTELFVIIAWGAYHYSSNEYGGIRNMKVETVSADDLERQFWQAFDLSRPDLQDVSVAVAAADYVAAERALAAHFRRRPGPVVANPVPVSDSWLRRADETMAHTYRLAGCQPYTFPGEIVWNLDPFNYNQWPVHLNRHTEWRFLASAYKKTGDPKYAREWEAQLLHWVKSMPVFIAPGWVQGPYNAPGRTSLSLDAGIRLGQTWFPTFEVFRHADVISDRALTTFARSCLDHARYLMKPENFREGSNWGAMESNGLYHIGVMMPEFADAQLWRDTAAQRQLSEMQNQVYPDGAQTELAPGYHGVSLHNFLWVMNLAKANALTLPEGYAAGLERMFEYYLRIAMPDLRTPDLNDSGRGHVSGVLAEGAELFPERTDFLWGATQRHEGRAPAWTCTVMPYAGWVVMRSGWSSTDSYLLFDAGPFGSGHQHEDKLGVILYAQGRPLIVEAGVYAYDTSDWRRYVLSTRGHNTVRMDGQDQNCRRNRDEYLAEEAADYGFFDSELYCYARDWHSAGYGPNADATVRHRRRVLFVKPDVWLLVDDFFASDDSEHTAEAQFMLNAASATVDESSLTVTSTGKGEGRVALMPLVRERLSVRVALGETEPEVRGFIPEGFEKLRPAPAVLYQLTFRTHGCIAMLLVPFEGDENPVSISEQRPDVSSGPLSWRAADGTVRSFRVTQESLECLDANRPFIASEEIEP